MKIRCYVNCKFAFAGETISCDNETTSMDFEIDKTVGNEGEYGVKFNEPTTGEIVRALGNPETLDQESLYYWSKVAADRLESQEVTIAKLENDKSAIISSYAETSVQVGELIQKLTARAEKAEAREKRNLKWANIFRKIARKKYEEVLDWYYASKGF